MKQSQNPAELASMKDYIFCNDVRSILEVGSRYGETLYELAQSTPRGSKIVSVELAGGPWGRPDSLPRLIDTIERLNDEGYEAHLILGDSKDLEIYRRVKALAPFDFVFIDGDHTYGGALNDWEKYGPMGKYVGFHDVNTDLEVATLWSKIKVLNKEKCIEFIADNGPQMGIGIVEGVRI